MAAIQAMKPETTDRPFDGDGWVFELKYDGFRLLAARLGATARLAWRSGHEVTGVFPELAGAVLGLPFRSVLLDGEAVILDESGRPSFQRLQRRSKRARSIDAQRAAAETPAVMFVFDLLELEGFDLRPLPLVERKAVLRKILPAEGPLRYVEAIPQRGVDLYGAVSSMGLEGIVAKRADSPYRNGYSKDWLKIRVDRTGDFAVAGFEPAAPASGGLSRLHLALREGGELVYAGTVGSGFGNDEIREIRARLAPARRPTPAVKGAPRGRQIAWVEPELVCEVRYKEWTEGRHLRLPVFLRLRDDKTVAECCRLDEDAPEEEAAEPAPEPAPEPDVLESTAGRPRFTRLDKVFWPEEGYTKGDLIEYYRAVSPWILPYLRDRPLVLDRYPDGIYGKSFYQKNAPEAAARRVRTARIRGGESGEIEYFLCDDEDSLLFLANLGAIPLHVWASRVTALERPDWCILDLDPKGAPFRDVVRIALAIGDLCEEIGLPCFVKTSGGSGLHLLMPLGGQCDHDASRQLAELLARVIVDRLPAIATTARAIPARRGRVYVDALQNGRGKLLAAPFSVRPRPGGTVSTPLAWSEVGPRLDPAGHTLKSVPRRLARRKGDPLLPVLDLRPDLLGALGRLAGLV